MKYWLPTVSLVLLCAGCARFEPQPISPADTAARLDARRLDDDGLKKFLETNLGRELENWPLKSWDLKTLSPAAFYFHPSLDVARAQWRVAQAGVRTAGGHPNPTLGLTPGYDFSVANGLSPWIPFFNLDVPVETAGKRGKRILKAQQLSESARLNIATIAWQVRSHVRVNLLDFAAANRRSALLESQLAVQERIVKLLEQRLAVGAISQLELTTARIAVNRTRLELGDARLKRAEAHGRLAESLGVSVSALDGVELLFDFSERAVDGLTSTEARQIALRGRSDILGALSDYAATEAELRLQIAKQFPDVHLNPGYQFDQGDNKWTLGLTFELPVLNQNQGPIAESKARREEAAARFTELQAKVIGEIDRAVAAYRVAREQLATSDSLLAAERQQQQSVEAQLKAGAVDQLDMLNVQLELGVATLAQLDGQARLQQSLGALEDALQRPMDETGGATSTSSLTNMLQRTPNQAQTKKQKQ
ncbi:MAG: TolC family protein [Verrucomicrobia bacterium]|nr:MAG: TolC family protein [Verrucomicrobiota bacterium]